eukprot:gene466-6877_t
MIKPILYDVEFDFRKATEYQVNYTLDFQIDKKTSCIELDGKPSFFKSISFIKTNEKDILFKYSHRTKKNRNKIAIEFLEEIAEGNYQLHLEYIGAPTATCESVFLTEKDEIIYTQMESHLCSRVFPCLDDNWNKNFFKFSFIIPSEKDVISNMEIEKSKMIDNNLKRIEFKKTPKIPAYILGFAIGKFQYSKKYRYKNKLDIQIFSVDEKAKNIQKFLTENAFKLFEICEDKFDIDIKELGINKIDFFMAPEFIWAAMENHGMIVLSDDLFSSHNTNGSLCLMTHEIVHHWIGNYVSFPTWIKEGITRYYEYILTAKIVNKKPSKFSEIFDEVYKKSPKKPIEEKFQLTYDYSETLRWFRFLIDEIGIETFEKNLRVIMKNYGNKFITEEEFLTQIKN